MQTLCVPPLSAHHAVIVHHVQGVVRQDVCAVVHVRQSHAHRRTAAGGKGF